jgi:hypothetical protein
MFRTVIALLVQLGTTSQPSEDSKAPPTLDPLWTRTIEAGVEWCAPVGGEPATALLVCTKAARLDMIDLASGRSRLSEPLKVQPGTQFAGAAGNVAYAYGPTKIYSFLVAKCEQPSDKKPGVVWQVTVAPRAETEGDPEFLTRIIAAKPTPAGVLIVRNDGRVAELRRDDGSPRWRHELPEVRTCKLHVRGHAAALLWKHGAAVNVCFIDLDGEAPRPRIVTVEDTLPIWTELIDAGLVAVWPMRFRLITPEGVKRWGMLPPEVTATATTVAVYVPQAGTTRPAEVPALLLTVAGDTGLCSFDFATGKWELPWRDPMLHVFSVRGIPSLWVAGDVLFCTNRGWAGVYDAATRERLAGFGGGPSVLSAATWDGFAYALFSDRRSPRDVEGLVGRAGIEDEDRRKKLIERLSRPDQPRSLSLVRQIMSGKPWPRPDEPVNPAARKYVVGTAGLVRETFWLAGTLVIVEDQRIRAYTLP